MTSPSAATGTPLRTEGGDAPETDAGLDGGQATPTSGGAHGRGGAAVTRAAPPCARCGLTTAAVDTIYLCDYPVMQHDGSFTRCGVGTHAACLRPGDWWPSVHDDDWFCRAHRYEPMPDALYGADYTPRCFTVSCGQRITSLGERSWCTVCRPRRPVLREAMLHAASLVVPRTGGPADTIFVPRDAGAEGSGDSNQ